MVAGANSALAISTLWGWRDTDFSIPQYSWENPADLFNLQTVLPIRYAKLRSFLRYYLRRNYSHIGFWQILSVFRPVILALTLFRAGKRGEIRTHTVMILNHLPPANWATRSCVQLIYVLMELPTTLGFLCLYLTSLATSYVSHIVV